jgi:membrane-bound lytic murein transglycosylase B
MRKNMNFNLRYNKVSISTVTILLFSFFVLSSVRISYSSSNSNTSNKEVFEPLKEKLIAEGVDSSFVENLINDTNVKFNEKFVKINVVGTGKAPDYSSHYNSRAARKSKQFLSENLEQLEAAEKEYGVPKEVITSILYVETRHGGYLGYNNIVSVFLSTALANQEKYYELNSKMLKETYSDDSEELEKYLSKLKKRSEYKSDWAMEQIVALEELDKNSPIPITEIEGSWAGAFGMSQFLPSSYNSWAVDGNGDGLINLFDKDDAIFSVANYLNENGWGKTLKKQRKAVWHYNHSTAYVNAVLKLSELINS